MSVAWNARVDFRGPAIDSTGQRPRVFDSLRSQPCGHVQAAHTMMTIADNVFVAVKALQVRGNHPHRNQFPSINPADVVLPLFADVDQEKLFTGLTTAL